MRTIRFSLAALAAVLVLVAVPRLGPPAGSAVHPGAVPGVASATATVPPGGVWAEVVRVIDGDTIQVKIDGQRHSVRYIGINTPETTRGKNEPWGQEATDFNAGLVEGETVYLVKDVSETDRYGRLLRYVFSDNAFVNAELVRQGYAQVATYPPDVAYQDLFLKLQREARAAGRGLWGGAPATPTRVRATPTRTRAATATRPGPTPTARGDCDPAYPEVCIAPYPPDLDCGDVPYRRFKVLAPDPHRFDNDRDGVGCES